MVTSTSSSGSSGPCGRRATRGARGWSGSVGQNPVSGPGDNWSRVRDQRLKGQTGQSVLMGRWPGRPGSGPTPPGLCSGRGEDGDIRFAGGVRGLIGVVDVQIVVEVEILVLVLVLIVVVLVIVVVIEVLIVKVLVLVVLILVVVEVDLVVFFIGVLEVAIVQVFFCGLTRDLLLDLSIGLGVFLVLLADQFIRIHGGRGLVSVVVMATVDRGHRLEHRMLAGRMGGHLGHRRFLGLALL